MKRTRSHTRETKTAAVAFVKGLPKWAEMPQGVHERLSLSVMSQAQPLSEGASEDVIHKWLLEDISPSS